MNFHELFFAVWEKYDVVRQAIRRFSSRYYELRQKRRRKCIWKLDELFLRRFCRMQNIVGVIPIDSWTYRISVGALSNESSLSLFSNQLRLLPSITKIGRDYSTIEKWLFFRHTVNVGFVYFGMDLSVIILATRTKKSHTS